jgi:hypothetical protein
MLTVDYIFNKFHITNDEYQQLDKQFGKYCYFVAQQLKRNNLRNNLTDEIEDIAQDLRWSATRAGVYTKRQVYLVSCMEVARKHIKDPIILAIVDELERLWSNKTRHGANKQKYGEYQEWIIENIVNKYVPDEEKPDKERSLNLDKKFEAYCKAIIWNCSKNLGKKITRERIIRSGQVSLSEHNYLCGNENSTGL